MDVKDRASKEVFVKYMQSQQDSPEIVLSDIINDMVDNKKYLSYTDHDEWGAFFLSMTSIVKQIVNRSDNLQTTVKIQNEKNASLSVVN